MKDLILITISSGLIYSIYFIGRQFLWFKHLTENKLESYVLWSITLLALFMLLIVMIANLITKT